jgi:hypothetical protein
MTTYLYAIDVVRPLDDIPGFTGPSTDFLQGTITTDCNNCALLPTDFVAWNLSLNIHGLSPGVLTAANSTLEFTDPNALYVATPLGLYSGGGWLTIAQGTLTNLQTYSSVFVRSDEVDWTLPPYIRVETVLPSDPFTSYALLGTPVPAVPEPGTWALMLFGFAALFLTRATRGFTTPSAR